MPSNLVSATIVKPVMFLGVVLPIIVSSMLPPRKVVSPNILTLPLNVAVDVPTPGLLTVKLPVSIVSTNLSSPVAPFVELIFPLNSSVAFTIVPVTVEALASSAPIVVPSIDPLLISTL